MITYYYRRYQTYGLLCTNEL